MPDKSDVIIVIIIITLSLSLSSLHKEKPSRILNILSTVSFLGPNGKRAGLERAAPFLAARGDDNNC